ncbi:MAG: 3-deoxy-7-phosphoheptulonate synthase [Neisseriaceae bacterium]|nr:MAG: 3-deoxy-7-phosphoheptulonate synthase [Neisseriaceae bacterium]
MDYIVIVTKQKINDINVEANVPIVTPRELKDKLPLSPTARTLVSESRQIVKNILDHRDYRLFVVVGPCSIHDYKAAIEYAQRLKKLSDRVKDTLFLIMRVYFEKPRTTVGWKGLINDPYLNDTFKIEDGLHLSRRLLLEIAHIGIPASTEALDPISPQYLQDLISWSAIGARTTESQTHRELASGLSSAVGFKNGTDGGLAVALNALKSVANAHHFLGINQEGRVSRVKTRGNPYAHIVLRGGDNKTNYDSVNVTLVEERLRKAGLSTNIMIDCSHENSNKRAELQPLVVDNIINQILNGNQSICALMIESNLEWGNQSIPEDLSQLKYGVSITDACIDWKTTEDVILKVYDRLKDTLPKRFSF